MKPSVLKTIIILVIITAFTGGFLLTQKAKTDTKVVSGYSIKDNEVEAVSQAVAMIKEKISRPDYRYAHC